MVDTGTLHTHDLHTRLGISPDDLVAMYKEMLLTRVLDQKIWALNRMGKAPFAISSQGHEGAQIGTAWALKAGFDTVLPYYRDLGVVLTLGMTPYEVMLGAFARADDPCSGGRQMPNHWGCSRLKIITGSSPISTHLPHAVGIAYALKHGIGDTPDRKATNAVVACYFGDGATAKGDFHEALNFAGIHQLPVVFVCENNGYAISVPTSKESAVVDIAERAHSYGMSGYIVDGNNVLDVYESMHAAVTRARQGDGPSLIEVKTYRYLAHTSDDDDRVYRSRDEVENWKRRDPLVNLKRYLIEQRLLPEAVEAAILDETQTMVDEAAARAEAMEQAPGENVTMHVWAKPVGRDAVGNSVRQGVVAETASSRQGDNAEVMGEGVESDAPRMNVIEAVRFALRDVMEADDRVMILGEDVGQKGGVFGATQGLLAEFGDVRVVDSPLAESTIVGSAIGLALHGLRPIAEIQFADFIHSAFDQIVSEAARIHYRSNGDFSVPMVIRAPWGGGVHGALYHSQAIEAFYSHIPGLKVVAPSTPYDVVGMLREAIEDPDPVLFLEHKKTYRLIKGPVPSTPYRVPIGKAEVVREGTDLTILTYGLHRHLSLEAAESLSGEANVEVVDLRTLNPLDVDAIVNSACKCGRVLVVHEDVKTMGLGAEVAALVAEEAFWDLDAPVVRLGLANIPAMPFASTSEAAVTVDVAKIVEAARRLLGI